MADASYAAQGIVAEDVAVVHVTDLLDGLPAGELVAPVVAGHDVVHELPHRPGVARGRVTPLTVTDTGDEHPGCVERASMHFGKVDGHGHILLKDHER